MDKIRTFILIAGLLLSSVCLPVDGYSINEIKRGDVTTIYTSTEYKYEFGWLEMFERDFLTFSVRACSDIHVALLQERNDRSFNITEVVIGGWFNTRSVLRNGIIGDQRHYLDIETPGIAHCVEFRMFWISWGEGRIRVGYGPSPGQQTFMNLARTWEIAHDIRFVGFSTGYGFTGVWKLQENQGYYLGIFTPDDFRYEYVWKSTEYKNNHLRFYVQACHDVHINLSPEMGRVHYEVVIGGLENTHSVIRSGGGDDRVTHTESDIVSCTEFREFWIMWTAGNIQVGKGADLERTRFLEWKDDNFIGINYVSFSAGYGSTGIWLFNEDLENVFKYYTQADNINRESYSVFLSTVVRETVIFETEACSDVWIALMLFPGQIDDFAQHIYIGTENNTKSGVKDGFAANPIIEISTPGILSCSRPESFWISWYGDKRRIGRGNLIGFNVTMEWDTGFSPIVLSVGFSNTHQNGGHYLMRRNIGDSLIVVTPVGLGYRRMWLSVAQDVMISFRIRACQGVHLSMSSILGIQDLETYELIIGSCYMTIIRDIQAQQVPLADARTPDALDCFEYRSFWISWLDGYIRVGRGSLYGRGQFIRLENVKPHPINAISISTAATEGTWEFETDTGDYLVVITPPTNLHMKWLQLHSWIRWFYFQVQGAGAHLVLASRYQDTLDAYHINIGANRNTEFSIHRDHVVLATFVQPGILNFQEFQDFYVSWADGKVQLGRSRYRSAPAVIEYQDPKPFTITAIGVHGSATDTGEWKLSSGIASEMSFATETYQSFENWWSVKHRSSIVFAIKSCSHAEVMLSAAPFLWLESDYVYTVVLHDQLNNSGIWRGLRVSRLVERRTVNLLSCDEERHFWLSWTDGHIALGHSRFAGENIILSYQDLNYVPITALSFSTFQGTGMWRVPLVTDEFAVVPPQRIINNAMTGGEVAGVVIGSLLMIIVFVVVAAMIILGPAVVIAKATSVPGKIRGMRGNSGGDASSTRGTVSASGFDNPLSAAEFSEITMS